MSELRRSFALFYRCRVEYSIDSATGEIGNRILAIYRGAHGDPSAKCIKCDTLFNVWPEDGRVIELTPFC